ncbi:hypothetical protein [Noviherbaspirillum agri]
MQSQIPIIGDFRRRLLRASVPILGLVSFVGGTGLTMLSAAIVYKQLVFYGRLPREPFIYVTVFSSIALFCIVAGLRLMFLRKDRTASIMPPIVWKALGILSLIGAAVLLVKILLTGTYSNIGVPSGFLFLSALFFVVASRATPSGPDDPTIL